MNDLGKQAENAAAEYLQKKDIGSVFGIIDLEDWK